MELKQLSERIFWYPYEEERDRPILGYIGGNKRALVVDAGHSSLHVRDFYRALNTAELPLPDLTAITHWHWDHSFGMPFVQGLTIAEQRTDVILRDIAKYMTPEYARSMMVQDEHIGREYAEGQEMKVCGADIVFRDTLRIDLGELTAELFHGPSPHTDDCVYVYVPEEKVLFLGDAPCGKYPDWYVDPAKAEEIISRLEETDFDTAVSGHWEPQTKEEIISFIRSSYHKQTDCLQGD
ncbi:MAG: MBL fold metallo-hydrolase [Solobacterium sp.]|nr:MBL fold metallo-hydrolase [Solobacterium sp.]